MTAYLGKQFLKSLNHLDLNHYTITSYPIHKLNSCESCQLFSKTFPLSSEQYSAVFSSGLPVSWKFQSKILHTVGLSVTSSVTVVVPLPPSEHSAILLVNIAVGNHQFVIIQLSLLSFLTPLGCFEQETSIARQEARRRDGCTLAG